MIRILDFDPAQGPAQREDTAALEPPPAGVYRWIDLVRPDAASLEQLRASFDLDALAIADCLEFGAISKVDDYDRYLFLVAHAFTADPEDALGVSVHEVHAFLGETFLITVHESPVPAQDRVWERAAVDSSVLARGPSWALYLALAAMVDATEPLVEKIDEEVDRLEHAILEEDEGADPKVAFRIKRSAAAMRRSLRPLRDTLRILHRRGDVRIGARATRYLRDLADVVVRLTERVEEVAESATAVQHTYQALQATKATDLMKKLTIFSAVFLPLGVIVGFWGQNFRGLPTDSGAWLAITLASMILVPAGLLEWFRQNWM
ncbi:MAG: magnesium transporter CorA family protein [Kofleriaceae bacterium]